MGSVLALGSRTKITAAPVIFPQEAMFCYLSKESENNHSEITKRVTEALLASRFTCKPHKARKDVADILLLWEMYYLFFIFGA